MCFYNRPYNNDNMIISIKITSYVQQVALQGGMCVHQHTGVAAAEHVTSQTRWLHTLHTWLLTTRTCALLKKGQAELVNSAAQRHRRRSPECTASCSNPDASFSHCVAPTTHSQPPRLSCNALQQPHVPRNCRREPAKPCSTGMPTMANTKAIHTCSCFDWAGCRPPPSTHTHTQSIYALQQRSVATNHGSNIRLHQHNTPDRTKGTSSTVRGYRLQRALGTL